MKLRLIKIRDSLAASFWFLPTIMALLSAAGALGSIAVDRSLGDAWVHDIGWFWSSGAEGARGVLSVVAGSVMTVVSIVFSLTITTLSQTSSHFGPRVLRNFTSDRGVQFTLGTFIATFIYCLLVLRTVRSVEESAFVPHLSVNIGVALALISLAVLIFFIHKVSQSIQAENIIAEVGLDFQHTLSVLFPERIGESGDIEHDATAEPDWEEARAVDADKNGYLQRMDDKQLMHLATRHDLQLKLEARPGDFIRSHSPLLRVNPPASITGEIEQALRECFSLGIQRTPHQDLLYSLQQLVEIGAHALSPGINEPFTALTCIDWLGASLRSVVCRTLPDPARHDESGTLRVVARILDFDEIARAAFDQIRIYGASNPDILVKLLETIAGLGHHLQREDDREVLMHHVRLIGADVLQIVNEADRERVLEQKQKAMRILATGFIVRSSS